MGPSIRISAPSFLHPQIAASVNDQTIKVSDLQIERKFFFGPLKLAFDVFSSKIPLDQHARIVFRRMLSILLMILRACSACF
jgi:hypothetical protein